MYIILAQGFHDGDDDDDNEYHYDRNDFDYHHLNLHAYVIYTYQSAYDENDVNDLYEDVFIY